MNAVTYSSVLKSFSHQKRFGCVWEIYDVTGLHVEGLRLATVICSNSVGWQTFGVGCHSLLNEIRRSLLKLGILNWFWSSSRAFCLHCRRFKRFRRPACLLGHFAQLVPAATVLSCFICEQWKDIIQPSCFPTNIADAPLHIISLGTSMGPFGGGQPSFSIRAGDDPE